MAGQYVAYTFFRVDPAWRRLPSRSAAPARRPSPRSSRTGPSGCTSLRAYSVDGVRPDSDFFLWKITERYEDLGELGAELNATPLAGWLETPYSYLATTKASEYTQGAQAAQVSRAARPTSSSTRS